MEDDSSTDESLPGLQTRTAVRPDFKYPKIRDNLKDDSSTEDSLPGLHNRSAVPPDSSSSEDESENECLHNTHSSHGAFPPGNIGYEQSDRGWISGRATESDSYGIPVLIEPGDEGCSSGEDEASESAFPVPRAETVPAQQSAEQKKREKARRKRAARKARAAERRRAGEEAAERRKCAEREAAIAIASWFRCRLAEHRFRRTRSAVVRLQALSRGVLTRATPTGVGRREHLDAFRRFYRVWGECSKLLLAESSLLPFSSVPSSSGFRIDFGTPDWASLRDQQAFIRQQELMSDREDNDSDINDDDHVSNNNNNNNNNNNCVGRKETDRVLTSSMEDAMRVMEENADDDHDMEEVFLPQLQRRSRTNNSDDDENKTEQRLLGIKRIHLSAEVVKWLKKGDPRYVGFFRKRMKQLSGGERSRILAKRLMGTSSKKVPIYETYLAQKSGFRILWTEKDDSMLVWYIAKHHRVSRLMRLIDDSKNRSERQRVSIHNCIDEVSRTADKSHDGIEEDSNQHQRHGGDNGEIVLDPLGNVPLKIYDIGTSDEIDNIKKEDWTPALHLTDEERRVVETKGTVLLLGRSGTGKTVCICNRMEYDRQQHDQNHTIPKNSSSTQIQLRDSFSQLFVARSPRLCAYVRNNLGERSGSKFVTFETLLVELEAVLPRVDGIRDSFPDELMMKFSVFKREFYHTLNSNSIDPLITWTNIRSFLKGSIEAFQSTKYFVSKKEYLSENNFGKKRCRLSTESRQRVYDIFGKYQDTMVETGAWDNCDRIVALIRRLIFAKTSYPELFKGKESWCHWSKIYVDEVQDYTQVEILLFFHLSGAGNLFLAGDPAQNVTKGVEFRFDDVRSVGYHIAGEVDRRRKLIPQKPKIVNVNFRSHAGILNAASAILSRLFAFFPDSAKQLGKDEGLFKGPRPGMLHKVKLETMADLVHQNMKGVVVLTHDDAVPKARAKLHGYKLVYGIQKAKGLEFKSVLVMDFFSSLPSELQKPWRELLLNRADSHTFQSTYPEVEGHLKVLYTAVTRCIDRLFFAETEDSVSGDAFLRFMTSTESVQEPGQPKTLSIATRNKIGDIENMAMTEDEWLASGITNAEAAEAVFGSDHGHACSLMEKAIYCFQQADKESFARKASSQLASFELRNEIATSRSFGSNPDSSLAASKLSEIEKNAALVSEKLLKENLLSEAIRLGRDVQHTILQRMYLSSTFFERYILQQLEVEKEVRRIKRVVKSARLD